eukprot:s1728_g5.t1
MEDVFALVGPSWKMCYCLATPLGDLNTGQFLDLTWLDQVDLIALQAGRSCFHVVSIREDAIQVPQGDGYGGCNSFGDFPVLAGVLTVLGPSPATQATRPAKLDNPLDVPVSRKLLLKPGRT